ncbi:MAG: 3-deoxy-D-manno-octulosonic acid kinase [Gammaproteobacteria bacterium]|nr:MAG: 3-deoxy-D-manno-octulosonic acid kinase [Gammaproteobacteria bacterium]
MLQIPISNGQVLLLPSENESMLSRVCEDWFDPDYWLAKNSIAGQSRGRNTTWFIKAPEKLDKAFWVLRHYYRGGLVAKVSSDKYIYSGLENTRCYQELEILQEMVRLKLPVPKPVAARVIRSGLFYQADLLMEKLSANDLVMKLQVAAIGKDSWQRIGRTIATFHNQGIYHADLNAHNIMIDEAEKVWLIDFDRCEKRAIASSWQLNNIERLERSFNKEKGLHPSLHFEQSDWQSLKSGYMSAIRGN